MSILKNLILEHLPFKKKTTPSGWISFNAPCCIYNGQSNDTRNRGGLVINGDDGLSYHCFNCGFKTSWTLGRPLSIKMRKFLSWLGVADSVINKTALDILRLNEGVEIQNKIIQLPEFETVEFPTHFFSAVQSSEILEYIKKRNLYLSDIDFYGSTDIKFNNRVIIPFYYNKKLTGFTARAIDNKIPKYLTESQPGYIFNIDKQTENKKFCIVCEGPIDALHIDAVSILGSELSQQQILQLESLDREIVIVADKDSAGKKLIDQAIELGWSVGLPNWQDGINDISDAVDKYGRILTFRSIINSIESNTLKIKLGAKRWFG